jgi:hypothetical protein
MQCALPGAILNCVTCLYLEFFITESHEPKAGGDVIKLFCQLVAMKNG